MIQKISNWSIRDWSIRTNPKVSESFRNLYPNKKVSFRSNPEKFFNPNQSEAHLKSIRTCNPNESGQSELIRINPNLQSESIRLNPNISESFGFIPIDQIHSDWPDSFGLQVRINSDLNGFNWIDFECSSHWFGLKNFFGLDRNETVWFGYKFRNDSENFGLVYPWLVYLNQSESFRIIPEFVSEQKSFIPI